MLRKFLLLFLGLIALSALSGCNSTVTSWSVGVSSDSYYDPYYGPYYAPPPPPHFYRPYPMYPRPFYRPHRAYWY